MPKDTVVFSTKYNITQTVETILTAQSMTTLMWIVKDIYVACSSLPRWYLRVLLTLAVSAFAFGVVMYLLNGLEVYSITSLGIAMLILTFIPCVGYSYKEALYERHRLK